MGGLVISVVAFIAAYWFIRDKVRGKEPESNMFAAWFGIAFAGPAAMFAVVYAIAQFFPDNYLRQHLWLVIPVMLPAIWIYTKVAGFFFGKDKKW